MRFQLLLLAAFLGTAVLPAAAQARTEVKVRAQILPAVKMRHVDAVRTVHILEEVRDGELEVPEAVSFEVFANTGGFAVDFQVTDPAVEEVTVAGLDAPIRLGTLGGSALVRMATDTRIARRTLHYRIRYAAGTPAGTRPAPLALSIRPDL